MHNRQCPGRAARGGAPAGGWVFEALHERGVRVPDDIASVGFDNWALFAEESDPPITTVDMQIHMLGLRAGSRMLAMINGEQESGVIRLPCRLVVRQSCGAQSQVRAGVARSDG